MSNIFVTTDPHFGHENILGFTLSDGSLARKFSSIEEHDETIISRHNEIVKPSDKVYILGDIAMKRKFIEKAGRLNGHKRLVRGNHDIFRTKDYLKVFEEIYAYRKLDNLFLSHIPIHPLSIRHDWVNVHGHIHNNLSLEEHAKLYGPRYILVALEHNGYKPYSFEELRQIALSRVSEQDGSQQPRASG